MQKKCLQLEAALREGQEEKGRLLIANENLTASAEEIKTAKNHAEKTSEMVADLRRQNAALLRELEKQPVGCDSIDFRDLALRASTSGREETGSELSDSRSCSQDECTPCPVRPEALLQALSVLHYRYAIALKRDLQVLLGL